MKKAFRLYITFSRTERMGVIGLCAILVVLVAIRATMVLWVHPASDAEKDKQLATAWKTFKRNQPVAKPDTTASNANDFQDKLDDNETPLPNIINLNTADSGTLVRLKGIGPVTAGKIIAWRKEHGSFTNINQLLEIRHFPDATFKLLKEHLVAGPVK